MIEGCDVTKERENVLQINFTDRVGLGFEIFQLFENHGIDKIAMEVSSTSVMMIQIRYQADSQLQQLIVELSHIPGVQSVAITKHMPFENREHELRTILNSVREGIIAVDSDGAITHMNQVACQIFEDSKDISIGMHAEHVFQSCKRVLNALTLGKRTPLVEGYVLHGQRKVRFFASGSPIINSSHQVIGAVFTIKDDKQIRDIISTVDKNRQSTTFADIIYQSNQMRNVVELAKLVANSKSTVLLRGESGTGKEMFAHAIHMDSPRSEQPFVTLNCAALPDSLLESELFGYEEGAFTGASKGGKMGIFEQANQGTLFLDEIGEVSPAVQVKLLRVLQEGIIRRVGGTQDIHVDVRMISATHRDLEEMIGRGLFREDLYYRLNVIPLYIPPLRERIEDIPLLATRLIQKIAVKLGKPKFRLSSESLDLFMTQEWPGNVRQLENVIERMMNVLTNSDTISPDDIAKWTGLIQTKTKVDEKAGHLQIAIPLDHTLPLKQIVSTVEKAVLAHVLSQYPSSRKAASVLGVSNTTILNKVHAYGLDDSKG